MAQDRPPKHSGSPSPLETPSLAATGRDGAVPDLDGREDTLRNALLRGAVKDRLFGEGASDAEANAVARSVGRYRILTVLGEGGMGTVFAAYDEQLDRRVAVKLIKGVADLESRRRMMREAQAMAKLSHPNVVPVFEVGEHEGQLFVAMEYVRGVTLDVWSAASERSVQEVLGVFLQAGRGLAAAHAEGLVHRDFKPHNAVLGEDGRLRVLDFGLAAKVDESAVPGPEVRESLQLPMRRLGALDTPMTETGTVMGTPAYMSLEQFLGSPADHRSDQFSFCVALWEALFGARPFPAETPAELVTKIASTQIHVPADSAVPERLRLALHRGLEPQADDRWPSMEALLEELAQSLASSAKEDAPLAARMGAAMMAVGVAVPVAMLSFATVLWNPYGNGDPVLTFCIATVVLLLVGGSLSAPLLWRVCAHHLRGGRFKGRWAASLLVSVPWWLVGGLLLWASHGMGAATDEHDSILGVGAAYLMSAAGLALSQRLFGAREMIGFVPPVLVGLVTAAWSTWVGVELGGGSSAFAAGVVGAVGVVSLTAALGRLEAARGGVRAPSMRHPEGILLAALVVPLGGFLALNGVDSIPWAAGSIVLKADAPGAADDAEIPEPCVCSGCISGTLGPSIADVDYVLLDADHIGFTDYEAKHSDRVAVRRFGAVPKRRGTTSVGAPLPAGLSLLEVGRGEDELTFGRVDYCVRVISRSFPGPEGVKLVGEEVSPQLVRARWERDEAGLWTASVSGTAEIAEVTVRLPDRLLVAIDEDEPLPFEAAVHPSTGVLAVPQRGGTSSAGNVFSAAGSAFWTARVENGQWSVQASLKEDGDSIADAPVAFESVLEVSGAPTSRSGTTAGTTKAPRR